MKRSVFRSIVILALLLTNVSAVFAAPGSNRIGINVLLNTDATSAVLKDLGRYGTVLNVLPEIQAVTMKVPENQLAVIRGLRYVAAANPDAVRNGAPVDLVSVEDFLDGINTWNLDAVNVTDFDDDERQVAYDGTGVYVAVLDTGLLDSWRKYFPEERIAEEYGIAFGGGGGEVGSVSSQPNKWEHDQNSHGTHVTSTILGYSLRGTPVNGVAPMVTIIPVKVLNQNGSGWSSVVAQGIRYVTELKKGPLAGSPVVINMSLGGPELDAIEKAAIDEAIAAGVIIVASAGNEGEAGMGYPGAYEPVISVAASGWVGEWTGASPWWYMNDVAESDGVEDFYITDFSSRAKAGQDLDVAAPGSWVVGPYQLNSGQTSYYFLGGTSMASPHVAGIVAMMMQKDDSLSAVEVESMLEAAAIPMDAGCRNIFDPNIGPTEICWGADATGHGLITADAVLD